MIDLITRNLGAIHAACEEFEVDTLWVFGYAVREDWVEGKSDVDFIAGFGESERTHFRQHMGFNVRLEDILDVFPHVVDLESIVGPDLLQELDRTKVMIYEKAPAEVPVR